ncbi:hypothetical protein BDE02_03G099800 [Populus trichocarpa]|nr:hypothetical protein BDE02_03G099800 [Populus trichocarpa]
MKPGNNWITWAERSREERLPQNAREILVEFGGMRSTAHHLNYFRPLCFALYLCVV